MGYGKTSKIIPRNPKLVDNSFYLNLIVSRFIGAIVFRLNFLCIVEERSRHLDSSP